MTSPDPFLTLELLLEERRRINSPNIVLFLNNTPIAWYTEDTTHIRDNLIEEITDRLKSGWHINAIEHEYRIYNF